MAEEVEVDQSTEPAVSSRAPWAYRFILVASLGLLLLAVGSEWVRRPSLEAPPEAQAGPLDMAIVPGQRVGFITLGLPLAEVDLRLGQGTIRPTEDSRVHLYPDAGLSLSSQEGRVTSVLVRNPNFKTRSEVHVGSDVDQVVRAFGEGYEWEGNQQSYQLHYWQTGIHFGVKNDQVESIRVTTPLL